MVLSGDLYIQLRLDLPHPVVGTIYLVDRSDLSTRFLLVTDWGEAALAIDGSEDSVTVELSNLPQADTPLGADKRFSDYFTAEHPVEGARAEFMFKTALTDPWVPYFVGAVDEVVEITDQHVVLSIGSPLERFDRTVGKTITRKNSPQAAADAIGKIEPIVLGAVEAHVPPLTRARSRAILKTTILASTPMPFLVDVDDAENWPVHASGETGNLTINDEHFVFTTFGAGDDKIWLTARAQDGTPADAHAIGDELTERAAMVWTIAGHPMRALDTVSGVGSNGEKVLLDAGDFVADIGAYDTDPSDRPSTVTLTSVDGLKINVKSEQPSYRRIENDETATPKTGIDLPLNLTSEGSPAFNSPHAAGGAGDWSPSNYATMRKADGDTLALKRAVAIDELTAPLERAFIAVEHWGLEFFGPFSTLTTGVLAADLVLPVASFDSLIGQSVDVGDLSGAILVCRIDQELIQISQSVSNSEATVVTRGYLGTTAADHSEGARVQMFSATGSANLDQEVIFHPAVQVLLEDSGGTMEQVGQLQAYSDVPPEFPEKADSYTDVQALSAWHGHAMNGLFLQGKFFNQESFWTPSDYSFENFAGGVMVSTISPTVPSSGNANPQHAHHDDFGMGHKLDTTLGLSYIMNPIAGGWNLALLQRVREMNIRFAHTGSAAGGTSTHVQVWVPNPNGGGALQIKGVTKTTAATTSGEPDRESVRVRFVAPDFPNGIKWSKILNKHFTIRFSTVAGTAGHIYNVGVDVRLDPDQLVNQIGSADTLGSRTVVYHSPALAYASGSSSYDNTGIPGPGGSGGGSSHFVNTSVVPELMYSALAPFLTAGGATNKIKNDDGGKGGIVRFDTDSTEDNSLKQVRLHFHGVDAPMKAEVYKVTIALTVAGHSNQMQGLSGVLVWDGQGIFSPTSDSDGSATLYDGNPTGMTRRVWRYTWNFDGVDDEDAVLSNRPTIKQLINKCHVRLDAAGTHAANETVYCDDAVFIIEVGEGTAETAQTKDAAQWSKVTYIDVTDKLADYADAVGKQVELRMNRVDSGSGFPIVADDDDFRPLLIPRVWWVFRFSTTNTESLERIAVDGKGVEFPVLANGFDTLYSVLTHGRPLLGADLFSDIDQLSFQTAAFAGMNKLRGVVSQRTEIRDLLNTLAEQAMVSGFWELGKWTILFKPLPPNLGVATASFDEARGEILEDTISISRRPRSSVRNVITVKAKPDHVKGGHKITADAEAPASIAKYGESTYEVTADFIDNQVEADRLAEQLLWYGKEPEKVVRFQTSLTTAARELVRGDVIAVYHSLFTSTRLEVIGINKAKGSVSSGIPIYEIEAVERESVIDV